MGTVEFLSKRLIPRLSRQPNILKFDRKKVKSMAGL